MGDWTSCGDKRGHSRSRPFLGDRCSLSRESGGQNPASVIYFISPCVSIFLSPHTFLALSLNSGISVR